MPALDQELPYPDLEITDKSKITASIGYAVPVFIVTDMSRESMAMDWSPVAASTGRLDIPG